MSVPGVPRDEQPGHARPPGGPLARAGVADSRLLNPVTARRCLARAYTRARKDAGHTQQSTARALGWSMRKQQMLESGEQVIAQRELDVLLPGLGVPDGEWPEWQRLVTVAHERAWWDVFEEEELSASGKQFVGLEHGATKIRTFTALVVPGLLQTEAYRRTLLTDVVPLTRAAEQVDALLEVNARRQRVLTGDEPLELHAILDEGALHRTGRQPAVMQGQLRHLAEMGERPNVTVQVVPFAAGVHAGLTGSFALMELGLADDPGFVYVEALADRPTYLEGLSDIYAYSRLFDRLLSLALSPDESLQVLRDVAEHPPGHN